MKFLKPLSLFFSIFAVQYCGSSQQSNISDIQSPTDLGTLSQELSLVSLIKMGTPFNPEPCQGFSLNYARLAKTAKVIGCDGDRQVKKEVSLTPSQEKRLVTLLGEWKVNPVPSSAYEAPCPAFDGGGYRAQALGDLGIEDYSFFACESNIPNGVLEGPAREMAYDEIENLVKELLR